ncbi:alpha-galactosidase [Candidatus Poribacteria bacterium]
MFIWRFIVVMLVLITLSGCGGGSGRSTPALQFQVEPVPGIYVQYDSRASAFRIGNELMERRISVKPERHFVFTTAFTNKLSGSGYIRSLSEEFSFRANGTKLSGVSGDFEYRNHEISGAGGVKELWINLRAMREEIGLLEVRLVYEIYQQMPVIRKWIEIENVGGSPVTIDSIQVESLNLMPGSQYDLEVYAASSGDKAALSPIVFDTRLMEGFFAGNEAPGVLKYSDLYSKGSYMSIGMRPHSQQYATEIQLAPGEDFISPAAFILFFRGEPDTAVLESFVAEHMTWSMVQKRSVWYENVLTTDETRQKIQMAAQSGAEIFSLAGNWMDKRGDWNINEEAHLEELGEYVHELGMKFGLAVELAVADPDSQVITDYPQWVASSEDGSDRTAGDGVEGKLMCLGSEYTLYAVHQIDELVRDLNLDYIKLTGPMIPNGEATGCFATDHVHRSSAESLWYIYDGLFAICRRLHSQHRGLVVDISTESYTPENTVDYALLKCADVEWPF